MNDWNWKAIAFSLAQIGGGLALILTTNDATTHQAGVAMLWGALAQLAPSPIAPK